MDISSSDEEEDMPMNIALNRVGILRNFEVVAAGVGMFYAENYLTKSTRKESMVSGYDWVMTTLSDSKECYEMFKMR